MARRNTTLVEDLVEDLIEAPWWISVILAIVTYGLLRYAIPVIGRNTNATPATNGIPNDIFVKSIAINAKLKLPFAR